MSQTADPHIVLIGGGTGSFTLLSSLKERTRNLTALVNMADDGGSTGVLRDQLGVLPPGDVRQCLVAMSRSSQSLRDLFTYRFPEGSDLSGHSFGNLFLSAVEMMAGNFADAVRLAGEVLNIDGQVIPVTLDNCKLVMTAPDGTTITGQYAAEMYDVPSLKGAAIGYDCTARLNPAAAAAIRAADLIVIAPGNLYASLIPALAVSGMSRALASTTAPLAYVCNLVNKPRHTVDYSVSEYAAELQRFVGKKPIDYVLYNVDKPSLLTLKAYALDGEYPVRVEPRKLAQAPFTAIGGHFLSHKKIKRDKNDRFILRSLIRHDADAIAKTLMELCANHVRNSGARSR